MIDKIDPHISLQFPKSPSFIYLLELMETKRLLLFLVGCIGTRSLLAYISKTISPEYLSYMGYAALVPAFGFAYIFLTGSRKTGAEVFGEKIWWNNLRPVHSFLYFAFAYNAINKNKNSWMFLFIDVLFGLTSFLLHHFT